MANGTVPHPNDNHEPSTPPDDQPATSTPSDLPATEPRGPGRPRRIEFATLTPREREIADQARREEKRKLYKEIEETRAELTKLQRQIINQPPTTVAAADQQNEVLQRLERMIQQQNERFDRFEENQARQRREADLRAYKAERLGELREQGEDVIEALVGGDSEEAIDDSIAIARAEYQYIAQREEEKRKRQRPGVPSSVTVQANNGRPRGTPPVMTPNTVEADLDSEAITEKTSDTAVRSGEYGKVRTQLLSKLKRGYSYQGRAPQR